MKKVFKSLPSLFFVINGITGVATMNAQTVLNFGVVDSAVSWTVPAGQDSIVVNVTGGRGALYVANTGRVYAAITSGETVNATLAVTPGQVLTLTVGDDGGIVVTMEGAVVAAI